MADLFASGRIVLFILGLVGVELLVLILVRNNGEPAFRRLQLIGNLGAGAALLLALRAAIRADSWRIIACWLLLALVGHLLDLAQRWSMSRTR